MPYIKTKTKDSDKRTYALKKTQRLRVIAELVVEVVISSDVTSGVESSDWVNDKAIDTIADEDVLYDPILLLIISA